jgi:hypothetical protein
MRPRTDSHNLQMQTISHIPGAMLRRKTFRLNTDRLSAPSANTRADVAPLPPPLSPLPPPHLVRRRSARERAHLARGLVRAAWAGVPARGEAGGGSVSGGLWRAGGGGGS